jgi:hypothetical protein
MAIGCAVLSPNRGVGLRCLCLLVVLGPSLILGPLACPFLVVLQVLVLLLQDGKSIQELGVSHILGSSGAKRGGRIPLGSSVHHVEGPTGK